MSTLNKWVNADRDTDVVSAEDRELARENERLRREIRILKDLSRTKETVRGGLLKKSFQTDARIGRAGRFSMIEHASSIRAAASFLRFMAMAVSRAWIFMFSSPLRMALARP